MESDNTVNPGGAVSPAQTANQPVAQAMSNTPNTPATSVAAVNSSPGMDGKKKKLIIGGVIGAVVAIILVVVLVVVLANNGGKTVACTTDRTVMGVSLKGVNTIKVKDNEVSSSEVVLTINLNELKESYKSHEKELVDSLVKNYEDTCKDQCKFDYDYKEGDKLKMTVKYEKGSVDGVTANTGVEGHSAQEIADEVKSQMESDSQTTCVVK